MKIRDGETQKVSWRSGKKGFLQDFDGDPTTKRYNYATAKVKDSHTVHEGRKPKKDIHHAGESSWKDDG